MLRKTPKLGPAVDHAVADKGKASPRTDVPKPPKQLEDMTLNDWRAAIAKVFDEFRILT